MRFITNCSDPEIYGLAVIPSVAPDANWQEWAIGKYIGEPQGGVTEGMVGIYEKESEDESTEMTPLMKYVVGDRMHMMRGIKVHNPQDQPQPQS